MLHRTPPASLLPLLLLVAAAWACARQHAQARPALPPQGDPDLGALLEGIRAEAGLPGLAAAVVGREGLVVAAAGRRRIDEDAPLQPTDRFHLGSATKALTALLAARLVERGVLSWDTTLAEAFPDWADSMDPAYRAVPFRDLLRNRAGMPALRKDDDWMMAGIDPASPLPAQRRRLVRNALHHPPAVPPGTFLYSNAGYVAAGAALERLTGRPWEELLREEVFRPLGMGSCGFGPPVRGRGRGQPFGHVARGGGWAPDDGDVPAAIGPAGTVHCSLADWATFVRVHMGVGPALVAPATLAVLQEPLPASWYGEPIGYAMGWMVADSPDGPILAHPGSNDRSYVLARVSPRTGRAYLVALNAAGDTAAEAATRASQAISRRYGPPGAPGAPR